MELGGLGWSMESTSRERPRMSDKRMNSFLWWLDDCFMLISFCFQMAEGGGKWGTYMSHIRARLADCGQEIQRCHPLFRTKSCLSRKIMKMRHQSLHHIFKPLIRALRIDSDGIFGDVIGGEVFHRWDFHF